MIWSTWPSSAIWVVGTMVGIGMFFSGVTRLMFSMVAFRLSERYARLGALIGQLRPSCNGPRGGSSQGVDGDVQ